MSVNCFMILLLLSLLPNSPIVSMKPSIKQWPLHRESTVLPGSPGSYVSMPLVEKSPPKTNAAIEKSKENLKKSLRNEIANLYNSLVESFGSFGRGASEPSLWAHHLLIIKAHFSLEHRPLPLADCALLTMDTIKEINRTLEYEGKLFTTESNLISLKSKVAVLTQLINSIQGTNPPPLPPRPITRTHGSQDFFDTINLNEEAICSDYAHHTSSPMFLTDSASTTPTPVAKPPSLFSIIHEQVHEPIKRDMEEKERRREAKRKKIIDDYLAQQK